MCQNTTQIPQHEPGVERILVEMGSNSVDDGSGRLMSAPNEQAGDDGSANLPDPLGSRPAAYASQERDSG